MVNNFSEWQGVKGSRVFGEVGSSLLHSPLVFYPFIFSGIQDMNGAACKGHTHTMNHTCLERNTKNLGIGHTNWVLRPTLLWDYDSSCVRGTHTPWIINVLVVDLSCSNN